MENKDGGLGYRVKLLVPHAFLVVLWISYSIVPRPSLTVFFAAVEKYSYFHGCENTCGGRPGYEARSTMITGVNMHVVLMHVV